MPFKCPHFLMVADLTYEWDVDNYEVNEPDRLEFIGTNVKQVCILMNYWPMTLTIFLEFWKTPVK